MKIIFDPANRVYHIAHDDGRHEALDIDTLRRSDPTLLKSLEESTWKAGSGRIRSPETAWKPGAGTMTASTVGTGGAKSSITAEDIDRMLKKRHGKPEIPDMTWHKFPKPAYKATWLGDEFIRSPKTYEQITPTPEEPTPEPTPDTYGHW